MFFPISDFSLVTNIFSLFILVEIHFSMKCIILEYKCTISRICKIRKNCWNWPKTCRIEISKSYLSKFFRKSISLIWSQLSFSFTMSFLPVETIFMIDWDQLSETIWLSIRKPNHGKLFYYWSSEWIKINKWLMIIVPKRFIINKEHILMQ